MCHFFLDTLTSINPCTFCNPTLPSLIYTGGEDQCSVGSGDVSLSLFGVCSTHSGYCTGERIRVDIQIPVHHGNLLGGQQP